MSPRVRSGRAAEWPRNWGVGVGVAYVCRVCSWAELEFVDELG